MSVEVRIEAALEGTPYTADPNGDKTAEVDIPSSNLDIEEVRNHELVKDVFENDDRDFHVYVAAETQGPRFTTL